MLPAERRVRRREEFTATVRQGRRVGSTGVVVHATFDGGALPARAGFIVGAGVGNAVIRNQVRRRLRHLMAPRLRAAPAGAVIVVRATAAAAGASAAQLATTLDTLLGRVQVCGAPTGVGAR